MLQIIEPAPGALPSLTTYAHEARFASLVGELRAEAELALPEVRGTVWMVNSTATGGGVAEMLPGLITLMRELGFRMKWAVIGADAPEFFDLTKRVHNLLHAEGDPTRPLGPEQARLLEHVGRVNAAALVPHLGPDDVVVVHDPQPVALGSILHRERGIRTIWRCHIGVDERTPATRAAWNFLRPFLADYGEAVFSATEYIPSFLGGRASIIYPGLDPLTHKNRDLSVSKLMGVLVNAGLQTAHEPVPTPDFEHQVKRLQPDGSLAVPGEIGLLFRPIVLQVSRWDRLKGWRPLLEGFLRMKARLREGRVGDMPPGNRRRLELARLVLAGPDPSGVADDPEGQAVFEELRSLYRGLSPADQADVALLVLPMQSRKNNGLIVNALQRCATVIVQNSLREGFGLTVTEAMWKRQAVLGTHAVGIRTQLRHGIDGLLSRDANDAEEIGTHLHDLLVHPSERYRMGSHAQRRVHDHFLVFSQLSRYIGLLARTGSLAS